MEITGNPPSKTVIENRWLQHFILLSAPLLTVIDVFIVNISIPSIKKSLAASDAQVELVIAGYLLGYASFMITGGRAGDFWGRKKVFMWGMFAFIITSCLCGIAQGATLLIAARFLQGISGAFMTPQALSYLQVLFSDPKERTKAIGFLGITLGTASTLGQFLGGYFSSLEIAIEGWRFIFFINLPIGLIALWASKKYLVEVRIPGKGRFDSVGVALIIAALATLIYPLTEGRELGYPWWSFALIGVSSACFILFTRLQRRRLQRQLDPLIDLRLFRNRAFNSGLMAAGFYFMMHTSYLLISTIYIQNGLEYIPYQTGLFFVAFGLSFMLSSYLSIRSVNRFGKLSVQTGMVFLALCYLLQLKFFGENPSASSIYLILFATGFSGGLVLPSLINLTLKNVPRELTGTASGIYNTVQQAASAMGICIVGGIFFYLQAKDKNYIHSFHMAITAEIILLIAVFLLITFGVKSKAAQPELRNVIHE